MFENTCNYVLLNGDILHIDEAKTSVFDRGYMFADGVYEGIAVYDHECIDNQAHLDRLSRSLRAIDIKPRFDEKQIRTWQKKLILANGLAEGFLYLQITRAIADRDFQYPCDGEAQITMFLKPAQLVDNPMVREGVRVCVLDDIRWKRRDIKSIALLPQAMAKQKAVESGCFEAWMEEDGFITEGASTSVFIVRDGVLITRPLSQAILPGVTRAAVLNIAVQQSLVSVEERLFSKQEAVAAQEAFITSASCLVLPVVAVDDTIIGDGKPGPITSQFRQAYLDCYLPNAC